MPMFINKYTSSSSPEIQKLHKETKELKLRAYQKKLEQKNKKLLEEINNNSNEEETETNNDERAAENKLIYKYTLGAILSYTLLMLFVFSTSFIISKLRKHKCNGSDWQEDMDENCHNHLHHQFYNNSPIVTLHNLTFGLVSAVVVSQIGSHQQQQQQSPQKNKSLNILTNQLLHATTKSASGSHILLRVVYYFITWSPRLYVLMWIPTGCACLLCGAIWGEEASGPLYVTGQAWLGIAITTVYLFFGLQETAKENNDDTTKEQDSVVNEHNDDDDSGDDSIEVDGNKHNDKDEQFIRDLSIGNSSSVSERNSNTVTSSAIIQTATSRSRFEVEQGDNDEEEGTLYLTGTDDDDNNFPQV